MDKVELETDAVAEDDEQSCIRVGSTQVSAPDALNVGTDDLGGAVADAYRDIVYNTNNQ